MQTIDVEIALCISGREYTEQEFTVVDIYDSDWCGMIH